MSTVQPTVLIVDDDPLHLKLYSWILEGKGYKCATALVKSTSVELPTDIAVDLILLDYRLSSSLTPVDVAKQLKLAFASAPLIVLSEVQWMPDEMRDYAINFVNKGDPQVLVERIEQALQGRSPGNNDPRKKDSGDIPASKEP